ncbi:MAG: AAA family ATPase [Myxococcales bacterium]|nr:AAA family ATPase [Myxococcales bacterium]USN51201.1 MAG: AAA family ATPase [Myxococcales bacterium]
MNFHEKVNSLANALEKSILGQKKLIDRLLLALLADGHLLVEGAPGLAKTKAIKALSVLIEGDFHRIQFTPDLLPADITGTEVYHPDKGTFSFQSGPVFHNLILADEINRAAAKVQSALLEAMGERQVSVGNKTYQLPELFLVMATQNPIEQEGTFSLPEAQLDRFMMHVKIDFPDKETEKKILALNREEVLTSKKSHEQQEVLSQHDIFSIRKDIYDVHMDPAVEEYLVQIIMATRFPEKISDTLAGMIDFGASPRASIYMDRTARAVAWLKNKDFVAPSDIHEVVHEILRHRIGLTFDAEAKGLTRDQVIDEILNALPLP